MSQQVAGEELARDAQLMTTTIKPQPPPSSAAVEERKAFLKSQLDGLMWVTVLDSLTMVTGRNSRMAGGAHPPPRNLLSPASPPLGLRCRATRLLLCCALRVICMGLYCALCLPLVHVDILL